MRTLYWPSRFPSSDSSLFGEAARAEEHADAFVQLGDLESAEAEYRLAIRRRPVNRTALQKLARGVLGTNNVHSCAAT